MSEQWRLLIGPYHTQYPWYNHNIGTVVDLAYATTLSSSMTVGSASNIVLNSGSAFPAAGGVWVGPVDYGEGWEYVVYSGKSANTLTGISRESTAVRDHNGAHGSGASVRVWYPVTSDNGLLSFTETLDETYSVISWTCSISGFLFPQHALRNNHIAIVQTNTGSGWTNYLLGFVDSPSASGDHTNQSPWSMTIRCIDVLLQAKVKSLRIGGLDLAKEGTATGSTPLVLAYDERASGDFTAAAPVFDASSTIDRNPRTLWIGERFMGNAITYPFPSTDGTNNGGQKFNQIYVNPPPGVPNTLKWIELIQTNDTSPLQGMALNAADPTAGAGTTYIWLLHAADTVQGDLIILCQDEAVFRQYNPLAAPKVLYENYEFFRRMEAAGGELWLRLGELNQWYAHVAWGDKNGGINHPQAPSPWSGPTVAAPGFDYTLRYTHNNTVLANAAAYWEVTKTRTAGYKWNTYPDQYVSIELPGLGLKLTEPITATVPDSGALLKISDSAGPSSSGLPTSGRLQIGDEQIDYSSKSDEGVIVSARHVNTTTAAIHDKDDIVFNVESSIPTDAHLLNSLGWERYGGSIVASRFKWWRSIIQKPRSPDEGDWMNDWLQIGTEVTGNTATSYSIALSPSLRCRHVMLTTDLMTTDPARARLNEIFATIDNSAYDTSLWLANGTRAGAVIKQLVINAGINTAAVVDVGDTAQLYDQTTADDVAWSVISDMADFAGCRLSVGRDSKITVADGIFWETGSESVYSTWAAVNVIDVQLALRNGIGISQMRVLWRTPDSSSKGTEVYPSAPDGFGQPTETKEYIYPNSSAAQVSAQKRYILGRRPYEFTVNASTSVPSTRPGEIHSVTWQYNRAGIAPTRKCVLKAFELKLKSGKWSETLHLMQIEREAEY